jgi:hypothetical protein
MIADWIIQVRGRECRGCAVSFRDGQTYFTSLWDKPPALERMDFCEACWRKESNGQAGRTVCLSHWEGTYLAPPAAPPDPIQKETAESLLRKLLELRDPTHGGACFILAVMLERKRLLRVKSQLREGNSRTIIYEQPKSGDLFAIRDPGLKLAELETVQRDVGALLENGIPTTLPDATIPSNPSNELTALHPTAPA